MSSSEYSFIDLVVLDEIRTRFAAGDSLALLSVDLSEVIWANGAGALLFGFPDIEAIMGAEAGLTPAQRRQIAATPGFPEIGTDRSLHLRLSSGVNSRAVAFLATGLSLPDGERAVLLAAPARLNDARDPLEIARGAIAGFTEAGYFAAFVGAGGELLAAAPGYEALGIAGDTLTRLVEEVADQPDRLVKRRIASAHGQIPAGIAHLTDDPPTHLLVVVDDHAPAETAGALLPDEDAAPDRAGPLPTGPGDADVEGGGTSPAAEAAGEPPPSADAQAPASPPSAEEEGDTSRPKRRSPGRGDATPSLEDRWYFGDDLAPGGPASPATPSAEDGERPRASRLDEIRALPAVRFVWRTDEDGRFSVMSRDFLDLVGMPAADVIGQPFEEMAARLGFDEDGSVSGLLARRDTWSGKTLLWPSAAGDFRVPVDLAALPIYGRDRNFEGFRGFGIARPGDAEAPPAPDTPSASQTRSGSGHGDLPDTGSAAPALPEKVVSLAAHRPATTERSLSNNERNAFREIGERLKDISDWTRGENEAAEQDQPAPAADDGGPVAHPGDDGAPSGQPHAGAPAAPAQDVLAVPSKEEAAPPDERAVMAGARPATGEPPESDAIAVADQAGDAEAAPSDETPDDREAGGDWRPTQVEAANENVAAVIPSAFAASDAGSREVELPSSVFGHLPVAILVHSGDTLHLLNDAFRELTGYRSIAEIEDAGGLGALFSEPYGSGEEPDGRMAVMRASDGREFPVRAHLQSIPWRRRKALLLSIVPVAAAATPAEAAPEPPDASAARIADSDARVEEMRTILDTATDGVVLITSDGVIRSINRPAEALFGYETAELAGRPFVSLFAVESQRAARDYLTSLSDNGVASVLNDGREVIGREAQGRFIPLFMTIGRLTGGGFCAVLRDITQWKRAEEELTKARAMAERASSQKSDFLARVSHEIRTPLNAIIGFSELMLDEKFGPIGNDRYRDYLRDINRSGNHVLDLVNDLLDISKIEAGEQEMSYEAVSLNDTLSEIVAMMQPQANRERVIIRSSFASRLPDVVADLRSVRQIGLNLLSNAIRFTPPGGQVIVSTAYETSGDVMLRVRDTGVGMTGQEIEQALKPFKQITSLKRTRTDGTGLGLPLTKAMVEANRARFSITSVPGEGTLVEICFPSTRVLAD